MSKPAKKQIRPNCIFCGPIQSGNRISGEHVWSNWMRSILPSSLSSIEARRFYQNGKPGIIAHKSERERPGSPRGTKIQVVCQACNSGWMSQLDSLARGYLQPMMMGGSCFLTQEAKLVLAHWFTMKMFVIDQERSFGKKVSNPVHRQEDRSAFMLSRQIPFGFRLWIGWGNDTAWVTRFTRFCAEVYPLSPLGPPKPINAPTLHSIVWGFGQLRAVMSSTTELEIAEGMYFEHAKLIQVWPESQGEKTWPPASSLSKEEMDELADGLRNAASVATVGTL